MAKAPLAQRHSNEASDNSAPARQAASIKHSVDHAPAMSTKNVSFCCAPMSRSGQPGMQKAPCWCACNDRHAVPQLQEQLADLLGQSFNTLRAISLLSPARSAGRCNGRHKDWTWLACKMGTAFGSFHSFRYCCGLAESTTDHLDYIMPTSCWTGHCRPPPELRGNADESWVLTSMERFACP